MIPVKALKAHKHAVSIATYKGICLIAAAFRNIFAIESPLC